MKAARALLDWSQADLARAAGVSEPTIKRLEAADGDLGGREATVVAIRSALEAAGVTFLASGDVTSGGPGVRLR